MVMSSKSSGTNVLDLSVACNHNICQSYSVKQPALRVGSSLGLTPASDSSFIDEAEGVN